MSQLLVIRHGIAGDADEFAATGRSDDERPLTEKGSREMKHVGAGLRALVKKIDLLTTSPLVRARETAVTHVVGDVRDRSCLIIDDMISTGGTIVESAHALAQAGARAECLVAATHGLLLPGACERMIEAGVARIYVTDSIADPERRCDHVEVVTIAPLLARTIRLQLGR